MPVSTANREGGREQSGGVMSSKCCECSLAVVQRCICTPGPLMCAACLSAGLSRDTSCELQSNTDASSLTAVRVAVGGGCRVLERTGGFL